MIEEGTAAGFYTYSQTPARLTAAYYSKSGFPLPVMFCLNARTTSLPGKTFADLHPYRVGASERYNYPKDFLDAAQQGVFMLEYVYGENANLQNLRK